MLACLDAGYRFGRRDDTSPRTHEGIGAIEAAIVALLGLLLGFAFAGSMSRLDARRELLVHEANAIGTAYLRVDLLPPRCSGRSGTRRLPPLILWLLIGLSWLSALVAGYAMAGRLRRSV